MKSVDYKIQKYTHKLKNANSQSKAHVYQEKLQEYHRLNKERLMAGGQLSTLEQVQENAKLVEEASDKIKESIENDKKSILEQLDKLGTNNIDTKGIKEDLELLNKKIQSSDELINKGPKEIIGKYGELTETINAKVTDLFKNMEKNPIDLNPQMNSLSENTEQLLNDSSFLRGIVGPQEVKTGAEAK